MKYKKDFHTCLAGKIDGYDGKARCVDCRKEMPKEERTRHTFRSLDECAHVWAQQKVGYGKYASLFFEGKSIWSYGNHFEIARFISPDIVLFTTRDYSMTTSKHKRCVEGALSHKTVCNVPDFEDHTKNAQHFIDLIVSHATDIKKGRANLLGRVEDLKCRQENAKTFLDAFGSYVEKGKRKELRALIRKVFFSPDEMKAFKEKSERHEASAVRAQATRERNDKIRDRERCIAHFERTRINDEAQAFNEALADDIEETWADEIAAGARLGWLQGDERGYVEYDDETLLRVKGSEIETSRGALVPVARAADLFRAIQEKRELDGFEIGHYTVSGIHDGKLVVGCHRIPMREVVRMAGILGLASVGV